jgi:hypothetical protein
MNKKISLIGVLLVSAAMILNAEKPVSLKENFKGHGYEVIPTPVTWHTAKKHAGQNNGYLVVITTPEENDFIIQLTKKATNSEGAEVWIGLNDEKLEGDWRWVSGEKITFQNWASGEPNNHSYAVLGGSEHFVHTWKDGKWNDYSGDARIPFIVEYDHEIETKSSAKRTETKSSIRSTR